MTGEMRGAWFKDPAGNIIGLSIRRCEACREPRDGSVHGVTGRPRPRGPETGVSDGPVPAGGELRRRRRRHADGGVEARGGHAHLDHYRALHHELVESGELVASEVLAGPDLAKIVRADGVAAPVVTDGPFQEFKEWLAGYQIVEVESEERALEIAARLSAVPGPGGIAIAAADPGAPGHDRRARRRRRDGGVPARRRAATAERSRRVSRTCCASSRRRSSARSSGASATSTTPRTRCRRRCSPQPALAARGVPGEPARLAAPDRRAAADRPAGGARVASPARGAGRPRADARRGHRPGTTR